MNPKASVVRVVGPRQLSALQAGDAIRLIAKPGVLFDYLIVCPFCEGFVGVHKESATVDANNLLNIRGMVRHNNPMCGVTFIVHNGNVTFVNGGN